MVAVPAVDVPVLPLAVTVVDIMLLVLAEIVSHDSFFLPDIYRNSNIVIAMGPPRLLDEFADHAPRNDRRGGDPRGSGARGGRDAAFSDDESLGGEGLDSESDFGGRGGGRSGGRSGGDPYGGGLSGGRSGGDPYGGVRSGGRSGGGDPYGGGRSGGHRRH